MQTSDSSKTGLLAGDVISKVNSGRGELGLGYQIRIERDGYPLDFILGDGAHIHQLQLIDSHDFIKLCRLIANVCNLEVKFFGDQFNINKCKLIEYE